MIVERGGERRETTEQYNCCLGYRDLKILRCHLRYRELKNHREGGPEKKIGLSLGTKSERRGKMRTVFIPVDKIVCTAVNWKKEWEEGI